MANEVKKINTPITAENVAELRVGDRILISGRIYCGRDAVLPKVIDAIDKGVILDLGIEPEGSVIFHTAVSPAGVGPTSSNKVEIENSIEPLSKAGVKIHLGKGALKKETVEALNEYGSVYAVIPPVTALLGAKTKAHRLVAFPELGMEAFYELEVEGFPAIIGAAQGCSIYDE